MTPDNPKIANIQLSREEMERYSRHVILPEIGLEGQKKLKAASVLIAGMGGLGSPVAMYLAAAGIGKLGIVDFDVVDGSNLQRQIIYATNNIGQSKLSSSIQTIKSLNPNVNIQAHEIRLSSENALEILRECDIVVDCTDNFPTRYLINDACVLLGKPNVYGSILKFEGQTSVFYAREGPCYRCAYPEPPPPEVIQNCAEAGVLGVLPGIIGTIQATEVLKLILEIGESLIGRIVFFDALTMQFREMRLKKNPDCPVCGEHPAIKELIDYNAFCGIKPSDITNDNKMTNEITVQELKRRLDAGEQIFLLDVREPVEYQIANIGGYLIPLNQLPNRLKELDPSKEIIVHCRSGVRSANAVQFLEQQGFKHVKNLIGGILQWSNVIDPSIPKY
ncbi:MAG: molybdopterin-synthase adenylyltransferase MoeB [Ignavibacteriales bacterium]|nr:molybdopterin-synthase adenylyltransferase MoeB [Ignavibacteriales bacterium]